MARLAALVAIVPIVSILLGAAQGRAAATLSCDFHGKNVQVIVANSKDGPRSCNAVCVWRYGNIALRGTGGAMLASGEAKSVYHSVAPFEIDAVVTSDLSCNR